MTIKNYMRKSLLGVEDLLQGAGTVEQTRGIMSRFRSVRPVESIVELNALDPEKYLEAAIFDATTNTAAFRHYTGAGWVTAAIASVASNGSYSVANVQDYGAIGDGTADDTAAILLAVATGLPTYCPPGTYRISQRIILDTGAVFFADSKDTVILVESSVDGGLYIEGNTEDVTIRDITISGEGTPSAGIKTEQDLTNNPTNIKIINVKVIGFNVGLYMQAIRFLYCDNLAVWSCTYSFASVYCHDVYITNSYIHSTGSGYAYETFGQCLRHTTINTTLTGGATSVKCSGTQETDHHLFINCRFLNASVSGYDTNSSCHVTFISCVFNMATRALRIDGANSEVALYGCSFRMSSADFIIYPVTAGAHITMVGGSIYASAGNARVVHNSTTGAFVELYGVHIDINSSNGPFLTVGDDVKLYKCTGDTEITYTGGVPAMRERPVGTIAVNGSTGATLGGFGISCVRNSAGNYTLTFDQALATSKPVIITNGVVASSFSSTSFNVLNGGIDIDFNCTVYT